MRLAVGDGHEIAFAVHGTPHGEPAIVLHGGPGSGRSASALDLFHLGRWRVVLFDQRGAGESTPHAGEPAVDLSAVTTAHLVADIERLRTRLGVERWLVVGGSWGATLALSYAQACPGRVSGVVLHAVTTTSREEVDWITRGVGRYFPEEHARFAAAVPEAGADGDLVAAFHRRLADPDPAVHAPAAEAWCAWDRLQGVLDPRAPPHPRWSDPRFRLAFARLVTHFWHHAGFHDEGALLAGCGRLDGTPAVLIHGRLDLGSPPVTAWRVHHAWPGSRLEIVEGVGHEGGAEGFRARTRAAIATLRSRR